jgi:hypothetical protein
MAQTRFGLGALLLGSIFPRHSGDAMGHALSPRGAHSPCCGRAMATELVQSLLVPGKVI